MATLRNGEAKLQAVERRRQAVQKELSKLLGYEVDVTVSIHTTGEPKAILENLWAEACELGWRADASGSASWRDVSTKTGSTVIYSSDPAVAEAIHAEHGD